LAVEKDRGTLKMRVEISGGPFSDKAVTKMKEKHLKR
jgi:hypothetical protein